MIAYIFRVSVALVGFRYQVRNWSFGDETWEVCNCIYVEFNFCDSFTFDEHFSIEFPFRAGWAEARCWDFYLDNGSDAFGVAWLAAELSRAFAVFFDWSCVSCLICIFWLLRICQKSLAVWMAAIHFVACAFWDGAETRNWIERLIFSARF